MHVLPIFVAQLLRLHYNKEKKKIFLLFLFILLDKNAGGVKCANITKMYVKTHIKGKCSSIFVWGPQKFLILGEKERTRSDKSNYFFSASPTETRSTAR